MHCTRKHDYNDAMLNNEATKTTPFEIKVIYSKRKTIELRFLDADLLQIKAPNRTSKQKLADVLLQKADWIAKTRRTLAERWQTPQMKQGEQILLLGSWHSLKILSTPNAKPKIGETGVITIGQSLAETGASALVPLYRQLTRQWTEHYAQRYAQRWQLTHQGIRITSASTRWGSCGPKNTLNFSWRLAMAPLISIEYLVVHELAHIKHRDHSKAFWQFLKQMMPDFEEGQSWLKQNGNKLPKIKP